MTISYTPGKDELRTALPLAYVCATHGILLHEGTAVCPFHDDHSPSFRIFGSTDGTHERWFCYPCGFGGDVFDLLIRLEGLPGLGVAISRAREILAAAPDSALVAPRPAPRAPFDPTSLSLLLEDARAIARSRPDDLVRPLRMDPAWADHLVREWGWGLTSDGWVLVPHWSPDGTLTGVKTRSPNGAKGAIDGSRFTNPYGGWRADDGIKSILLCEGESDTVVASAWYPDFRPLGLPSGSSSFSENWIATSFAGRHVVLAFDADDAGRRAAKRWEFELAPASRSLGVLVLPEGTDLRQAMPGGGEIEAAVGNVYARKVTA